VDSLKKKKKKKKKLVFEYGVRVRVYDYEYEVYDAREIICQKINDAAKLTTSVSPSMPKTLITHL